MRFASVPSMSAACSASSISSSCFAALSPLRAALRVLSRRRSTSSTSLSTSSVSTRSTSARGSSVSLTWATSGFAKTRTTCATASTPRMSARKRLPSPSPRLAPSASPAMSTTSMVALTFFGVSSTSSRRSSRGSGTATTPRLDSADVNAYAVAAACAWVSALNRVVLPTLGRPTMPSFTGAFPVCW